MLPLLQWKLPACLFLGASPFARSPKIPLSYPVTKEEIRTLINSRILLGSHRSSL